MADNKEAPVDKTPEMQGHAVDKTAKMQVRMLPVLAWLYTMHTDGGPMSVVNLDQFDLSVTTPWGRPGIGYSESYRVTEAPLTDHATATAALSELRAEVERLRVDAERYKTWRDAFAEEGCAEEDFDLLIKLSDAWTKDQIDSVLDAARSAASGESAEGGV